MVNESNHFNPQLCHGECPIVADLPLVASNFARLMAPVAEWIQAIRRDAVEPVISSCGIYGIYGKWYMGGYPKMDGL